MKEHKVPILILMMQALLRRLPPTHPKRSQIEESLKNYESGYRGEVSIDYWLEFLPKKETCILHDLRLLDKLNRPFQIDTVIISAGFIILIDVKNHSGTLTIDPNLHQMKQKYKDNTEKFYDDPVQQGKMHEKQFAEWLSSHNFPPIPIVSLVLFSNQNAFVNITPISPEYLKKVIHSPTIPKTYDSFCKTFDQNILSTKDCKRLSRTLIKNNVRPEWNVLTMFNIDPSEIILGTHCPKCNKISMSSKQGNFECLCGYTCSDVYDVSLYDFALIFGRIITNRECCEFLQVSPTTAYRILNKVCVSQSGTYKDRKYLLPYPEI